MQQLTIFKSLFIFFFVMHEFSCRLLRMKQIECLTFDPEYAKFDLCKLDTSMRNSPSLSLAIRMLKLPMKNINFRIEVGLLGISSPITVLNNSWDGCAFLKSRKSNKVFRRLYQYIAPYTNLNHSCPINLQADQL
ncbi:uncharacterized protein LOC106084693 isoform X2 [Stomoxys calcitrans]|uniref:uncharacterized protein LOC106084693 isoform X2 n=1 Tax=Stomoxys calcitrans TaxID=35570 RepID=UPI0027E3AD7C|nr:uncharacterized protein LOC106084693 isoform X2 [Stomoxys calcitrans]